MKAATRKESLLLRRKGMSIKDIAKLLRISSSTASRWCKHIKLTKAQAKKLEERRKEAGITALKPWINFRKELKSKDILEQTALGANDVGNFSRRDLFMVGLGLYWGEGYKRGSQELGFTNSDKKIIQLYIKWLEVFYKIPPDRLIARVTINSKYKLQESSILKYWSDVTNIPLRQFTKTSFITSVNDSNSRPGETYYGTVRIKVRNGTSLRRRILGSIQSIKI